MIKQKTSSDSVSVLAKLLGPYDGCALECDGLTRVLSTVLTQNGISHQVFMGSLSGPGGKPVPLHFWVEFPDLQAGLCCDYRARMWLRGDPGVIPHGVFSRDDYPAVSYRGEPIEMEPLDESLFVILTAI